MESHFREATSTLTNDEKLLFHYNAQTISFYMDVALYLAEHLDGWQTLSLLDVGPRTGVGLAFLRLMHHPLSYSRIKFDPVTGIDIDPNFVKRAHFSYPDIEALNEDIFGLPGRTFDLVMSSHTIEHVQEPLRFLNRLGELANKAVIIACPFEEDELVEWHCNRITYRMLSEAGFSHFKVYHSIHWHNSLCVIASKWY